MAEVQQIREVPAKLAFYQPQIIEETVETCYTEEYQPTSLQPDNYVDPIRFFIRGSEHWIDFEKSFIEITGTFIGKDGTDPTSAKDAFNSDKVGIVNNFFHSLFSSIHVNVNDTAITFSNENYPYLAYIQNLVNYSPDFQTNHGELYGWRKDTTEHMDKYEKDGGNGGSDMRKKWITSENKLNGILKLKSPIFLMKQYLLSFLNVEIILNRVTNPAFYISGPQANTFKFRIDSMVFHVRKIKCIPSFNEGIENMLNKDRENIVYSLQDARVFTKTYPGFGTEINEDNLFHGVLPDRIIIGIVDNSSFGGKHDKNPFNFRHKNIQEIGLMVNGMPFPSQMIPMNFEKKDTSRIYHAFLDSLQAANPGIANHIYISKKEFGDGYTFFSFDMSPDQYGKGINHEMLYNQPANIKMKIKFHPLTASESITIIYYFELASRMVVDGSRQVQVFAK